MTAPLVSVITPTVPGREHLLMSRCIPSIAALDWDGPIEHIIVSDRNPGLADTIAHRFPGIRLVQLGEAWRDGTRERSVGAFPWQIGSWMALGEYVAFCGDDDELFPDHVRRHVQAMTGAGADFTGSMIEFWVRGQHWCDIGDAFAHGRIDATGLMCRADALRVCNWPANGQDASDWHMLEGWMIAGLKGVLLDPPATGQHHDGWAAKCV